MYHESVYQEGGDSAGSSDGLTDLRVFNGAENGFGEYRTDPMVQAYNSSRDDLRPDDRN